MGCAASSQGSGAVITSNGKMTKNCIDPETGENEPCDQMVIRQNMGATPLVKTNSLTITDKSEHHARTGEEPAHPLPEGDYGDKKLGITVSMNNLSLSVWINSYYNSVPVTIPYDIEEIVIFN